MASTNVEVQVGASGRLVIPAQLRKEMGLQSGDRLIARVEQGQLIFEKADTILERLQDQFAHLRGQGVVEELIAERRLEAQSE